MGRRQTNLPRQWLILDAAADPPRLRDIPRNTGIAVVNGRSSADLRRQARIRRILLREETLGELARVHDSRELMQALLGQVPLILLSPLAETPSHPEWPPMPRMRAAALARLSGRRLWALGGMNPARFMRVERLGFQGWAGISAFRI